MNALPVFEGYQVIERLESGAITDWYRALQQPLGRPVFIKALSSSILPSSPLAASLEREAHVLALLEHPGILRVLDFRRDTERMWLVLEHVDGVTLSELLKKRPALSEPAAVAIALEVTSALGHAHGLGVTHRDVRPPNIRVTRSGQVKLSNFRASDQSDVPDSAEAAGNEPIFQRALYMSPEQILGEAEDARSDLFSLGVVLYQMLAGRLPFEGPSAEGASQRIRHAEPTPLARYVPKVGAAVERITLRCLEKLPSDRFSSATELAQALARARGELTRAETSALIAAELADAGLAERPRVPAPDLARPPRETEVGLRTAVAPLLIASALVALGWALFRPAAAASRSTLTAQGALPLVPANVAYLRVVADPWAHVFVDGQKVETTPFARALPLSAGTHHVRLEHPHAPAERRTITLVPGESLLLDVAMKVPLLTPRAATPTEAALDGGYADDSP